MRVVSSTRIVTSGWIPPTCNQGKTYSIGCGWSTSYCLPYHSHSFCAYPSPFHLAVPWRSLSWWITLFMSFSTRKNPWVPMACGTKSSAWQCLVYYFMGAFGRFLPEKSGWSVEKPAFVHSDRFCERAPCGGGFLPASYQPPPERAGFGCRIPAGLPGLRLLPLHARPGPKTLAGHGRLGRV